MTQLRQFSGTTVKMEFSPHYLKVQTSTLLFSAFCQIHGTCSIKMQINVLIQEEHLILKIRYSLLSSSPLQLFTEFTEFIDRKHETKCLTTAMASAAVLKFSQYCPDAVLLQMATDEYLWRKKSVQCTDNKYTLNRIMVYEEFSVLLIYPQQFYKDCLQQWMINFTGSFARWLLLITIGSHIREGTDSKDFTYTNFSYL